MKTAIVKLTSTTPYSQGKHYTTPKLDKELHCDYEQRTWADRLHLDEDGNVFIPPMALKNCLSECAKYLGIQVPGKGKANYTKHFEAGLMVMDRILLSVHKSEVESEVSMKW